MPTPASPQSISLLARVQRWLGLDDADDAMSECPCAVTARIERAAAEARAKRLADKELTRLRSLTGAPMASDSADLARETAQRALSKAAEMPLDAAVTCPIGASRGSGVTPGAVAAQRMPVQAARDDDSKFDRAATYAMGGYFHSSFLADTFVYLPEVWLGSDGEH